MNNKFLLIKFLKISKFHLVCVKRFDSNQSRPGWAEVEKVVVHKVTPRTLMSPWPPRPQGTRCCPASL